MSNPSAEAAVTHQVDDRSPQPAPTCKPAFLTHSAAPQNSGIVPADPTGGKRRVGNPCGAGYNPHMAGTVYLDNNATRLPPWCLGGSISFSVGAHPSPKVKGWKMESCGDCILRFVGRGWVQWVPYPCCARMIP